MGKKIEGKSPQDPNVFSTCPHYLVNMTRKNIYFFSQCQLGPYILCIFARKILHGIGGSRATHPSNLVQYYDTKIGLLLLINFMIVSGNSLLPMHMFSVGGVAHGVYLCGVAHKK
ncbi:hypothetical protein ACJX0J_013365, partial [Zea mays]